MKLAELYLDRYLYRDNDQDSETKDSTFSSLDNSDNTAPPVPSGGAAQDINEGNVMVDSANLPDSTIAVGDWGWTQLCVFTSDDTDTVLWTAEDFISANGETYAIDAGTTDNMAQKTYIYLSLLESETEYKITTDPSLAVGTGKVIIAVAEPETDGATFNLTEATQIVGDNIVANTIDAGKIKVGTLIVGTNVGLGTALGDGDAAADVNSNFTSIIGGRIRTGNIESTGYSYSSGVYSVAGTQIDLDNGVFRSPKFAIDSSGNAYFNGSISAAGGTIGGWSINSTSIYTGTEDHVGYTQNSGDITLYSDGTNASIHSRYFYIDASGILYGTSVILSGQITATSGKIGNWNIDSTSLYTGTEDHSGYTTNVGDMTLYSDATNSSIHAYNWYIDVSGNMYARANGLISGVDVQSGTGTERIILDNGNYIRFYAGDVLRASIRGTTTGGIFQTGGSYYLQNDAGYYIQDSTSSDTKYGGISIPSDNKLRLTCGTNETCYVKSNDNATDYALFTSTYLSIPAAVFSTGEYIDSNSGSNDMRYYAGDNHEFYQGTTIKGIFDDNLWVQGNFTAVGTKNFLIAHPDGTPNKLLRYVCQESPEVLLRHRGKGNTGTSGKITIDLPTHFILITEAESEVTVNLTSIGNHRVFLKKEPTNSKIDIVSSDFNVAFHYEVIAVRKGYADFRCELDENDKTLPDKDIKLIKKMKSIPEREARAKADKEKKYKKLSKIKEK